MILITLCVIGFIIGLFYDDIWNAGKAIGRGSSKKSLIASNPKAGLSVVAQHLYDEYMELPEAARPFPDIVSVLKGLDSATAHDEQGRNDHYDGHYHMRASGYESDTWKKMKFEWQPDYGPCMRKRRRYAACEFCVYLDVHNEIKAVQDELAKTQRELNRQENAHHVDTANELIASLRREREIQTEVRREIEGPR